jgi:hypothetical protein
MRGSSIIFCVLVFVHCGWSQGSPVSKKGTITVKKPARPTLTEPDLIKAVEMPPDTDTTRRKQFADYAKEAGVYNKNYDNVVSFLLSGDVGGGMYYSLDSRSGSLSVQMLAFIRDARRNNVEDGLMIFEDIRARREDGQVVKLKGFTANVN